MTTYLAAIISVLIASITLSDWRKGMLAVLVVGVLQDAFRKLTPGVPAYYIIWSMLLYLLVVVAAIMQRSVPQVRTVFLGDTRVQAAGWLFVAMILVQLINALMRWNSFAVPIFGALFYLGPLLAMLVAYGFATGEQRVRQYLGFYLWVLVPTCLTVYLSPSLQEAWPVLRDVGTFTGKELIIYDVGAALKSYSGVLRSGEIASWHAATAAIFLATLSMTAKGRSRRLLTGILIAMLIGVIILTGRRKMLMALSIFFVAQWALMVWYRRGTGKVAILAILIGTVGSFSFTLLEPTSESSLYVQRSTTVYGDAGERLQVAFELMRSAFSRSAGLGLGAGAAAQGGRYAGIDQSKLVGGSSESGLGMLMVELGLPGILATLWLLIAVARRLIRDLPLLAAKSESLFLYQAAFLAFLFANLMTFTVATQIYGDLFVLIILGTVAGFALRIDSLVRKMR